jgi:Kef-type K+ transport system membrane component KefB
MGIVFGPSVLSFVPNPEELVLYGEIGLLLLVMEAGLATDVQMLRIIGLRCWILYLHFDFPHLFSFFASKL